LPLTSRREFLKLAASAGAGLLGSSVVSGPAAAKAQVNWLGWQGYDVPLKTENFLDANGIELAPTYLANNDEIVTKLAAHAPIDIVTLTRATCPAYGKPA
jgi:spermidine/putrescine-binding protein